ncbi:contact-dependent growth inhibition system immunity protein [Oleiagrimonas soli]|uniref:Uncharacterized protein n=1 Tax=Oleiagrimonas soli TaxID=1543381 RepID=A0A841KPR6_9GAMM|nr:contact-dependent growth inhibition system immunity protein [Oleiagrimonas soli]MBB6183954.1 hypothetical protein [Oleiagrimonas soli]
MLKSYGAFVYLHGDDDLIIGTRSGPGAGVMIDWDIPVSRLSLREVSNKKLGEVIRGALMRGRNIPLPNYKDGEAKHMELRGVKTRKALYRNTKCPTVAFVQGEIIIGADRQYGVGCYEPIPGTDVRLPESASDEEIGQAVRNALNQSVG